MTVYFVRHGQTNSNAGIESKHLSQKQEPLNAVGVEEARAAAIELKDTKIDVIISSPYVRALQTAEEINAYHNLPITIDERLSERLADVYVDTSGWQDLFDFDKNVKSDYGESLEEFFDRINALLDEVKSEYASGNILIVAHGGVHHAIYAYCNHVPRRGNMIFSPMKNCEIRTYKP